MEGKITVERLCMVCQKMSENVWIPSCCVHFLCFECVLQGKTVRDCKDCLKDNKVTCGRYENGCKFMSVRDGRGLEDHFRRCFFHKVPCPNACEKLVFKKNLVQHLSTECNKKLISCKYCTVTTFSSELKTHLLECDMVPVDCKFCSLKGINRCELNNHLYVCDMAPKPCPLEIVGCHFEGAKK